MPQSSGDLAQLGFLLGRAYYSYIGFLERRLAAADLDRYVKPGMGSLLFALFRQDDRTITELGRELQLAKSTMTGMVARAKKTGLVTLQSDKVDRRAVRVRLTALARTLEPRCRRTADGVEDDLCAAFPGDESEKLRSMLTTLNRVLVDEVQQSAAAQVKSAGRRPKVKSRK